MYWFIAIIAAVIILGFLANCFIMWLAAKIIRADGGTWINCVKLNWMYIWVTLVVGIVCGLLVAVEEGVLTIGFAVVAAFVMACYLIKKTMDVLDIGCLMYILFCIVESILQSAISFSFTFIDRFFPFIEQLQGMAESAAGKF